MAVIFVMLILRLKSNSHVVEAPRRKVKLLDFAKSDKYVRILLGQCCDFFFFFFLFFYINA